MTRVVYFASSGGADGGQGGAAGPRRRPRQLGRRQVRRRPVPLEHGLLPPRPAPRDVHTLIFPCSAHVSDTMHAPSNWSLISLGSVCFQVPEAQEPLRHAVAGDREAHVAAISVRISLFKSTPVHSESFPLFIFQKNNSQIISSEIPRCRHATASLSHETPRIYYFWFSRMHSFI